MPADHPFSVMASLDLAIRACLPHASICLDAVNARIKSGHDDLLEER
jgi:hypothetical protein